MRRSRKVAFTICTAIVKFPGNNLGSSGRRANELKLTSPAPGKAQFVLVKMCTKE